MINKLISFILKIPRKVRRLFFFTLIFLYLIGFVFPATMTANLLFIRATIGFFCVVFSLPGIVKILKMYFAEATGKKSDLIKDDLGLPRWAVKGLVWEARLYHKLFTFFKKLRP